MKFDWKWLSPLFVIALLWGSFEDWCQDSIGDGSDALAVASVVFLVFACLLVSVFIGCAVLGGLQWR